MQLLGKGNSSETDTPQYAWICLSVCGIYSVLLICAHPVSVLHGCFSASCSWPFLSSDVSCKDLLCSFICTEHHLGKLFQYKCVAVFYIYSRNCIPTVCQQSAHCDLPNLPASQLIFMLSLSFFIIPPSSPWTWVFSLLVSLPPFSLSTSFDVCVSDAWCGQMTAGRCHTLLSPVTEESGEEGTNSEVSSPPACRSPSPGANADAHANQVLQSRPHVPPSCLASLALPSSLHISHLRACPAPSSLP